MPFLEQDLIDNLPSLVASSIVHMPSSLHGYIVQVLCCFLLPLTMGLVLTFLFRIDHRFSFVNKSTRLYIFKTGNPPTDGVFNVIEPSVPGIIMAVLQYTTNSGSPTIYCRNKIGVVFGLDF